MVKYITYGEDSGLGLSMAAEGRQLTMEGDREHWLRIKKNENGKTEKMYLKYHCSSEEAPEDYPDAFVDWEIQNMRGGVVRKNRVWCQKKDCPEVMRPEEMVQIVFGCAAMLVYREMEKPLFVCA